MVEATLSDPENYALAAFPRDDGAFTILVGNIREGSVPAVNEYLYGEATDAFGAVKESGSAKGSVPDRWDAFVVVDGDAQSVLAFMRERLGAGASQFRPRAV